MLFFKLKFNTCLSVHSLFDHPFLFYVLFANHFENTFWKNFFLLSSLFILVGVLPFQSLNIVGYPLVIRQQEIVENVATTRAAASGRPCAIGRSLLTQSTCVSDGVKVWNLAPTLIKECTSLYKAKKLIKQYVRTLPI